MTWTMLTVYGPRVHGVLSLASQLRVVEVVDYVIMQLALLAALQQLEEGLQGLLLGVGGPVGAAKQLGIHIPHIRDQI